jgi:ABC-2 type transport system permease protein
VSGQGSSSLTGTRHLVRLALRRDRIRLPVWILGLPAMSGASAVAVQDLYNTPEKVAGYGATVTGSAAGKLLNGTPVAVDTMGGITAYEITSTAAVIVALMVTFLVVRHTRAEEETGRAELLRGTVLGRHAATAATLAVAIGASVLAGVLDALVLAGTGLSTGGSLLHGAGLTSIGLVFTAIALAAAQLTANARGALGIAGAVMAVLFLLRGVGAVQDSWLVWLSPFGWQQAVNAYGDQRWWPLALVVALAAVVLAVTVWLTAHRDAGAGLWHPSPGRPRATRMLGTPVGLAFRLQRGLVIGWTVGLVLLAGLFGALGREVITLVESNPDLADVFGAGAGAAILDAFFAYSIAFMSVLASAFTLASMLRLRQEEDAGRAESVLATGLSRTAWVLGSVAVTVLATVGIMLLVGVAMGGTHAVIGEDSDPFWSIVGAAVAQAPAALLVGAVALLLQGLVPRWSLAAWAVLAFALVQVYLGELLRFPGWVAGLSPFWHLPEVPVEDFTAVPALVVGALAVLAGVAGLVGFRRRDVAST